MKVVFVNRFFYPDLSATSQMLSDLAFALAGQGMEIHVVTSRLRYDAPGAVLPARETIQDVQVHRVRTTRFGRAALPGRIVDYASFYAAASSRLASLVEPGDIVVAKTDPPLISLACHAVACRRGALFVNWVQDLYPETAEEMSVPFVRGFLGPLLRSVRDRSLAKADANVAVGDIMAKRLARSASRSSSIHVIPNWSNDIQLFPVPPSENGLRGEWGLADTFVIAYSGNLGRAHDFQTLLGAADALRAEPDIAFLFVGGGKGTAELRAAVKERRLDHLFRFQPYQPTARLAESLSVGDIHWISLRPEFEGLIVPSKVYGILAVARPVLAISDPDGELAPFVEREGCGLAIRPGDAASLAASILRLKGEPDLRRRMGLAGRRLVEGRLSRGASHAAWASLLKSLPNRP